MFEFYQNTQKIEIKIRGEVVFTCSLIEALLAKIILLDADDKHKEESIKFNKLQLDKKIETAVASIRKRRPEIYKLHADFFEHLKEIVDFRNQMAHCLITWDYGHVSYFYIWNLSKNEEDIQFYNKQRIEIDDAITELDKIIECYNYLVKVFPRLEYEFQKQFPNAIGFI